MKIYLDVLSKTDVRVLIPKRLYLLISVSGVLNDQKTRTPLGIWHYSNNLLEIVKYRPFNGDLTQFMSFPCVYIHVSNESLDCSCSELRHFLESERDRE